MNSITYNFQEIAKKQEFWFCALALPVVNNRSVSVTSRLFKEIETHEQALSGTLLVPDPNSIKP